jgi:hypothetical protein
MSIRYAPRLHDSEDRARHAGVIYVLMLVVAVAFGGFVWRLYSGPEIPRVAAPAGPYMVESPVEAASAPDQIEQAELADNEAEAAPFSLFSLLGPASASAAPDMAAAQPQPAPAQHAEAGPYVAQLAALHSPAAAQLAWRQLSTRAPELFAAAQLDVERADLGQSGVYYRVRAGYFAERGEAARFCERIRQMGQDCIVAAR